jgi:hypothetical protein
MATLIRCPRCKSETDASASKPGSIIKCVHCRGDMRVPEGSKTPAAGGMSGGRQSTLFRRMTNATVPGQRGRTAAPMPGSGGGRGSSDRGADKSGLYLGAGIAAGVAVIIAIVLVTKGKSSEPTAKNQPRKEVANRAPLQAPPAVPAAPAPPVLPDKPPDRTPPSSWEPDAMRYVMASVRPVPTEAAAEKDALHWIEQGDPKRILASPFRYMPFVINSLVSEEQRLAIGAFKVLHAFCEHRNIKFADDKEPAGKNPIDLTRVNDAHYRGYQFENWASEWWPRSAHKLPDAPGNLQAVEKTDWLALVSAMKPGSYHDESTPSGAAFRKVQNLGQAAWIKLAELIDHEDLSVGRSAAQALMELTGERKILLPNEQNRSDVRAAWVAWINKNK